MSTSYEVKIWDLRRKLSGKTPSYVVRWKVGTKEKSKTFKTKALAESFLSDLRQAAKKGEPFELVTGLPISMAKPADSGPTFFDFARSYMAARWVHSAARTRETMTYALLSLVPVLTKDLRGRPDDEELRAVLRDYAFLPDKRRGELRPEQKAAFAWLEAASLPLANLLEPAVSRSALDAVALRFDGEPAAANTVRRKRAVLHHMMESAVELKKLPGNPLHAVKWKPPKATGAVDPRTVVNPVQVRALLDAVSQVGRTRGPRMVAMFACMYYAALRPEEASGLRRQNCDLPTDGWGLVTLEKARPQANKRWTNSGETHDERGLKHRAKDDTREIPIPPVLVVILREHIEAYGAEKDGRLFRTSKGRPFSSSAYSAVWQEARRLAFPVEQVASPLAARPYDLRHAAVSLWLNAGVPPTEVAQRAGHGVDVLLRVYAKCIEGQRARANGQITTALES
ncbi:integrase [Planomonospora parontospora subsp. parontospora]|uniref:Integrase n=2 Tax=Planomonospora parontospora TaxID=58119 RepID=A0AA37BGN2_9ACTN|nr:tyrosine-type recombinase/integrase [Planomonospora parontospora]GGK69830.1 integrase [Planomonospora parontospora]GII09893.1 integrase [Planomonospora parontospora subsp. parontospora]